MCSQNHLSLFLLPVFLIVITNIHMFRILKASFMFITLLNFLHTSCEGGVADIVPFLWMKLKPRDILSDLVEVTLILRGGVKTRIQAWISALVYIASVHTIRGECTQEVPPFVYVCIKGGGKSQHRWVFQGERDWRGKPQSCVPLSTIKGFWILYSWNGL